MQAYASICKHLLDSTEALQLPFKDNGHSSLLQALPGAINGGLGPCGRGGGVHMRGELQGLPFARSGDEIDNPGLLMPIVAS